MGFQNKKVAILGLGIENRPLAAWLIRAGAKVAICDKNSNLVKDIKDIEEWRLGEHYLDSLTDFEIVFRTPGIPFLNKKIQEAKARGVVISSQTKLFFDFCGAKIIGVTGTKGKGTTSSLITSILKAAFSSTGKKIHLVGNIGKSAIEIIDEIKAQDYVVMELSSFQLQDLEKSPHIGVVLNVSQDHLDLHRNEAEYLKAKTNILSSQKTDDFAIISADFLTSIEFAAVTKGKIFWFSNRKSVDCGTFVLERDLVYRDSDSGLEEKIISIDAVKLRGKHNLSNIAAAITASKILNIEAEIIQKAIREFPPPPHRIQFVGEAGGVEYYDDSYATSPAPAYAAINSFTKPLILIAGGSDKGLDYQDLAKAIVTKKIQVVLMGPVGGKIKEAILAINKDYKIFEEENLKQAFARASNLAQNGEIVLLSPAAASFNEFKNATQRGETFQKMVEGIH